MPDYHFFLVASNGRIESVPTYAAFDGDMDAMLHGTQLAGPYAAVEVWEADRLVCRIPATRGHAGGAPAVGERSGQPDRENGGPEKRRRLH